MKGNSWRSNSAATTRIGGAITNGMKLSASKAIGDKDGKATLFLTANLLSSGTVAINALINHGLLGKDLLGLIRINRGLHLPVLAKIRIVRLHGTIRKKRHHRNTSAAAHNWTKLRQKQIRVGTDASRNATSANRKSIALDPRLIKDQ